MKAQFIKACAHPSDFPEAMYPEVAFGGRSNCGKSSLMNALTGHNQLARTSSTPGRTQQINFFSLQVSADKICSLVDLPGYGFAKAPRDIMKNWWELIDSYLLRREGISIFLLLCDIRRAFAQEELTLIDWCHKRTIIPLVVLTKSDKVSKSERNLAIIHAKRELRLRQTPMAVSIHEQELIATLRDRIVTLLFDEAAPSREPR